MPKEGLLQPRKVDYNWRLGKGFCYCQEVFILHRFNITRGFYINHRLYGINWLINFMNRLINGILGQLMALLG